MLSYTMRVIFNAHDAKTKQYGGTGHVSAGTRRRGQELANALQTRLPIVPGER